MPDRDYDTFSRFLDCYWNEDGPFRYGDSKGALIDFIEFEHSEESVRLLSDFKGISAEHGFPKSKDELPGYDVYMHGLNYLIITNDEAERLISILKKSLN